ncbi:hypothetical protein B0H19DRAFT_430530 [Mycena capillaripes]|nr:hypothetical protein B0H19DRAFT_430530 [Mycena capillaripes]
MRVFRPSDDRYADAMVGLVGGVMHAAFAGPPHHTIAVHLRSPWRYQLHLLEYLSLAATPHVPAIFAGTRPFWGLLASTRVTSHPTPLLPSRACSCATDGMSGNRLLCSEKYARTRSTSRRHTKENAISGPAKLSPRVRPLLSSYSLSCCDSLTRSQDQNGATAGPPSLLLRTASGPIGTHRKGNPPQAFPPRHLYDFTLRIRGAPCRDSPLKAFEGTHVSTHPHARRPHLVA